MKRSLGAILLAAILLACFQSVAFAGTLILPAKLKTVDSQAFYGDGSITEVKIPDGAVSIGEKAFAYSGLKRVIIPNSVTQIAGNAFEGISALTIVSSSDSYARQYASQYSFITWEDSAAPITVTVNSPLTRENVLSLLDAIDPDGAYIIRNSSTSSFTFWFGSAKTIGEGLNSLSTAVHEQCHDFCGKTTGLRYNSIQGKYMPANERIYIGNGQHILVSMTDVFPSSEMVESIPESLRTYRFDTYVDGDPVTGSIQFGPYGMLDEFAAYCWGVHNDIQQVAFRKANNLSIRYTNSFLAYAEFRYYILHYMLYAKDNYPTVYSGILNNSSFRQAFNTIDNLFAVYADKQKSSYFMSSWNVLMQEMSKTEYVNMANLLKQ